MLLRFIRKPKYINIEEKVKGFYICKNGEICLNLKLKYTTYPDVKYLFNKVCYRNDSYILTGECIRLGSKSLILKNWKFKKINK